MKNIKFFKFFTKGLIEPLVIECSPPKTNGNNFFERIFHLYLLFES